MNPTEPSFPDRGRNSGTASDAATSSDRRRWIVPAAVVWLLLVVGAGAWLMRDSLAPGQPGEAPASWPSASAVTRTPGAYTLVIAAHPRCPCTRASFDQLDQILVRGGAPLATCVLFVEPREFGDAWVRSDLWRRARSMPGVTARIDPLGVEARRFGMHTSGNAALYDPDGRLVYQGGLTGARGHDGPNAGSDAVNARLAGHDARATAPVYGCGLETPAAAACPTR
jgi:hypothetical protein